MKAGRAINTSICDLSLPRQELMSAFVAEGKKTNRPRLMLTAAVSAGKGTIESGYQIAAIGSLVFSHPPVIPSCGGWGVTMPGDEWASFNRAFPGSGKYS